MGSHQQPIVFNGIHAGTGRPLFASLRPDEVPDIVRERRPDIPDDSFERELRWKRHEAKEKHLGVRGGVNPTDLAEAGWGVIFAHGADPQLRAALAELLDHRRAQAARLKEARYREFSGPAGYRPGETKDAFLIRQGAAPGPVDPNVMPYYLLIVGDPETIPYEFQAQLDVAHAVGRLHFATLEEYARYAHSVVMAETRPPALPRRAAFFGVEHPDDLATILSSTYLLQPLASATREHAAGRWAVETVVGAQATKPALGRLLGGPETPALLFTASHGIGFDPGDERQQRHQGALLCGEWPGAQQWAGGPVGPEYYLSADDIGADARLHGLVAFHFACYGGGTPRWDPFAHRDQYPTLTPGGHGQARAEVAPASFVARLPQRLLSHPQGGALAVVGHIERAWPYSFFWEQAGPQLVVFEDFVRDVMAGKPIGLAMEWFNIRYADLASTLSDSLQEMKFGKRLDPVDLSRIWTANNDARGYAIVGDPAVRLRTSEATEPQVRAIITLPQPATAATRTVAPPADPVLTSVASTAPAPAAAGAGGAPPPSAPVQAAEMMAVEYGLLDPLRDARARLSATLTRLLEQLGTAAERALSAEVTTSVSDDLSAVTYAQGRFSGATVRAVTRLGADGDVHLCLPRETSAADEALWRLHHEAVSQAQAQRATLLKLAVEAASGLLGTGRSA